MKSIIIISGLLAVASAALRSPYTSSPFGRQQPALATYRAPPPPPQQQPSARYSSGGSGAEIPILRLDSDIQPDGSYSYAYETGNGISASEQGVGGQSAQGQAQWTAPDGTPVQLSYVADENGYQPSGSHIPTPPPVPEQILRALEYIRTHPSNDEGQYQSSQQQQILPYGRQQAKVGYRG